MFMCESIAPETKYREIHIFNGKYKYVTETRITYFGSVFKKVPFYTNFQIVSFHSRP